MTLPSQSDIPITEIRQLMEAGNAMATLLSDFQAGTYDGDLAAELIGRWEATLFELGRRL